MAGTNSINVTSPGIVGFTGTAFVETATTNHAILVGGATSSTIGNVGPGSSGQVLQSGGASADPAYSTATYPTTATGTGKHLYADGTNWVASTPTFANTAGTAGKMLLSDGTNFVASTPTFPNASATSRKIIVSDGTNWTASTETYAVPDGSGNVLTSNGTNWIATAPPGAGNLTVVTGSLTNAQIKALHATPVQIIAAPGANKMISLVRVTGALIYGGTNVFTAAASQSIAAYYGTAAIASTVLDNASIISAASKVGENPPSAISNGATATYANVAINLYNPIATEIGGNAANNNTFNYAISYYTLNT